MQKKNQKKFFYNFIFDAGSIRYAFLQKQRQRARSNSGQYYSKKVQYNKNSYFTHYSDKKYQNNPQKIPQQKFQQRQIPFVRTIIIKNFRQKKKYFSLQS